MEPLDQDMEPGLCGTQPGRLLDSATHSTTMAVETVSNIRWPTAKVPVEIFEIITSYLSRAEVKSLRLVCREFEIKVSAHYFKNVVVPFRSELYTSSLSRDEFDVLTRSTPPLFPNGMRIFESFGPHILRFALSLELDEEALAYPPIKPTQEAVPSFWGIYRWPHQSYHRYSDLEDLEQTADETQGMKEALKCLTKVTNLGLCCDAGLGYLCGPDDLTGSAFLRQPVFATQNWRSDQRGLRSDQSPVVAVSDFNKMERTAKQSRFSNPLIFKRGLLEKMLIEAGYNDPEIGEAAGLMLETEGRSILNVDFDETLVSLHDIQPRGLPSGQNPLLDMSTLTGPGRHPLIPSCLTRAQKELLLELEWAHRAMIQSYIIGITDNAMDDAFVHLTTLTIAKIPGCHLDMFFRCDFWKSLCYLSNVHLGVIADWRKLSKPAPGCIDDFAVQPSETVAKVYTLLNEYIGRQRNIESVHFEWIGGGEFGASISQRNQNILPAPLMQDRDNSMSADFAVQEADKLLQLPYVKHLSLKNCWVAPHILIQTIRQLALSSLEKLELESVSLTPAPTTLTQATLNQLQQQQNQQQHQAQQDAINFLWLNQGNMLAQANAPAPGEDDDAPAPPPLQQATAENQAAPHVHLPFAPHPGDNSFSDDALQLPDWLSWAGILEHFSPGPKIRDLLAPRFESEEAEAIAESDRLSLVLPYVPDALKLARDEKQYRLRSISLRSCGYVSIDANFSSSRIVLANIANNSRFHSANGGDGYGASSYMQYTKDRLVAKITTSLNRKEAFALQTAFGMTLGWHGIYDDAIVRNAIGDGGEPPGMGRFSGILEARTST